MEISEYVSFDAVGLAELVRAGEVTPLELVNCAITCVDEVNPDLNAVVVRRDGRVRAEASSPADGPLSGVPFLVKDMDGVLANEPNTASSRSLVDWRPESDSELFARYKRAGLLIIGKTNAPEFGIMAVTESELRGPCRNPWDLDHTPGGSSGGSAAAVAARVVPVAHAGDGGGSIRIPASACGLFGIKPTRGRQPLGPDIGEGWDGLVVPHVVSRTVRDSAAFLDVTHGADSGAPYAEPASPASFQRAATKRLKRLRIGYSTAAMLGTRNDSDCISAVEDAASLFESLGHQLVEVDLPVDRAEVSLAYLTIVAANVAVDVAGTKDKTGKTPKPEMFELPTWFLKQIGDEMTAYELACARHVCQRLGRDIATLYDAFDLDVHLSSTMAAPPVVIGSLAPTALERMALSALRRASTGTVLRNVLRQLADESLSKTPNTQVFNMTGQPAMNVPLWWNEAGLPIGVQLAGRFGDEVTLFQLATEVERARPWIDRVPPITVC